MDTLICSTILWHRSTEYPIGLPSSPMYEKGTEASRWPILTTPRSLMRFSTNELSTSSAIAPALKKAASELLGDDHPELVLDASLKKLKLQVENLLDEHKIDGVLAVDEDASLVIHKVSKTKGFKIPNDIAIIGYAGKKLAKYISPSLTTVNQNGVKIGKAAARILIDRLEGKKTDFVTKIIATNIVKRGSTSKID